jgi:uncharacterized protein with von Willebrand factor type A (vWA) domain
VPEHPVPEHPVPEHPVPEHPVPRPVPGGAASGPDRWLVAFARALRAAGLAVPVGSVTVFARALGIIGLATRSGVYWAGRATLVTRVEDLPVYDRVFASFWEAVPSTSSAEVVTTTVAAVDDEEDDESPGAADGPPEDESPTDRAIRYSAVEVLSERDFASLSALEWAEAERLIARLRISPDVRRTRRLRPGRAHRGHPDLRTTVRRSLRTGGEPVWRAWRTPTSRRRRLILLLDVSGSMEPYARALLRFAHAAILARGGAAGPGGGAEVFALGTRLTRLTRELTGRDPDAALAAATASVADASGGTRLGEGLAEFNQRWGTRGLARGAVVVVLSDGWDRGDPRQLGEEMARLHRVAHRVVWANPLKASAGYQPLARGMSAALPWVDDFVEGHALRALEHLAAVVAGDAGARREGRGRSQESLL